jgi:hypothetical protein
MKKFEEVQGIFDLPATLKGGSNDSRAEELDQLNDNQVVVAYKVPWKDYGHLKNADDDIIDAVWGMQDGRRDVRQLKTIKEMK